MGRSWDSFKDDKRSKGWAVAYDGEKNDKVENNGFYTKMRPSFYSQGKKERDNFIAFMTEVFTECLRVIRPGGHALVWSLPRTSHWTGMALENAGWEVRDCITHLFGQGFPKSMSLRSIGHPELGTALKPAAEFWWLVRKPLSESTVAQNILTWGCGGLNIDQCRVGYVSERDRQTSARPGHEGSTSTANIFSTVPHMHGEQHPSGRFPSHLLMSHDPRCVARGTKRVKGTAPPGKPSRGQPTKSIFVAKHPDHPGYADEHGLEEVPAFECHPSCPVRVLGEQSGERKSGGRITRDDEIPTYGVTSFARSQDFQMDRSAGTAARYFQQFHDPLLEDECGQETVQAWECVEGCPVKVLGEQAGESKSPLGSIKGSNNSGGIMNKGIGYHLTETGYGDEGSKARYFQQFHDPLEALDAPFHYFSKASKRDRDAGLEGMPEGQFFDKNTSKRIAHINHKTGETTYSDYKPSVRHNIHPTVKQVHGLMRWLVRLITHPGGIVLDPFCGSGSTCCAAVYEGMHFIGIEQSNTPDAPYVDIARARIAHAQQEARREESEGQEYLCVDECPIKVLGEQSGVSVSKATPRGGTSPNPMSWGEKRKDGDKMSGHSDTGTAARYFTQFPPEPVSLWDEEVAE